MEVTIEVEDLVELTNSYDLTLLDTLIPFMNGFAIAFDHNNQVIDHYGAIPHYFPRQLHAIKSHLNNHPSYEQITDDEIAVGEYENYIVHLLGGKLLADQMLNALLVAIPNKLNMDRLLAALPTGVIKLNSLWQATYCNEYAEQMFGLTSDELLGRGWLDNLGDKIFDNAVEYFRQLDSYYKPYKAEAELISPLGNRRNISMQISATYNFDRSISEYYLVFQDVTSEYSANQKAHYLATHDSLTGLKNRGFLLQKIEDVLVDADKILTSALIYIDLNDFKLINDTYGHEAGDKVLKVAAQRLSNAVRQHDVVARIGGDEFVIFLQNVSEVDLLKTVAGKIQKTLNQPISLDQDITVDLISSFGLSHGAAVKLIMDDAQEINIDNWLRSADIAMYSSKARHDGSLEIFDEDFHKTILAEKQQFLSLKTLVESHGVKIHFQPIVQQGKVVSVEALARFITPEFTLSPDEAIDLAKKYNYQSTLFEHLFVGGLTVYQELLKDLAASNTQRPKLNINLEIEMLQNCDFADRCFQLVTELGLSSTDIYLEITEKVLENNADVVKRNLDALKNSGFMLSMDDFGTGYSSITRLINYNFDQIKIDRSFFHGVSDNTKLQSALKAAVRLGQALEIEVLGEGVETEAEMAIAEGLNVSLFQGFYFCKPCDKDSIKAYISR